MEDLIASQPDLLRPRSSILRSASIASNLSSSQDDDWLPDARPVHSSLPHIGFSARNDDWNSVQKWMLSLFSQKKLESVETLALVDKVRYLAKSELGPFIYDYYKNQLLMKGMWKLRDSLSKQVLEGRDILDVLSETWDIFYREILPQIQFILFHVQAKDLTIRDVTLLGFRDYMLLKADVDDVIEKRKSNVPAGIRQMLLVLQSVCESATPHMNFLRLEKLVALVVNPYLGYSGLYLGDKRPAIQAKRRGSFRRVSQTSDPNVPDPRMRAHQRPLSIQLSLSPSSPELQVRRSLTQRQASQPVISPLTSDIQPHRPVHTRQGSQPIIITNLAQLAPLVEYDAEHRRYSASTVF